MKDSKLPVPQSDTAQSENQFVALKGLVLTRDNSQGNDFLRGRRFDIDVCNVRRVVVEALNTVDGSRQDKKQADSRDFLFPDVLQIKAARFHEACSTEYRPALFITVVAMKDSKLPVPQSDTAQSENQFVALKGLVLTRDNSQGNDFLRGRRFDIDVCNVRRVVAVNTGLEARG